MCRSRFGFLNTVYNDLLAMGVDDLGIIGVGKDEYTTSLEGMINERTLPWVSDIEEEGYPVWEDYGAVQRSTYFLDREGNLIYQFNITTLDPADPEDYNYLIFVKELYLTKLISHRLFAYLDNYELLFYLKCLQ